MEYTADLQRDFNPRSPRGGATMRTALFEMRDEISIHAPHEGERRIYRSLPHRKEDFNPRSPRGGATRDSTPAKGCIWISIHAPHEGERLSLVHIPLCNTEYFNPRSPRGGATRPFVRAELLFAFQSTLPTRGSDGGKVHLYAAFPRIY